MKADLSVLETSVTAVYNNITDTSDVSGKWVKRTGEVVSWENAQDHNGTIG